MSLKPEKMVEELRIAAQVEMPEDLTEAEDKWMYLLGRVAGAETLRGLAEPEEDVFS